MTNHVMENDKIRAESNFCGTICPVTNLTLKWKICTKSWPNMSSIFRIFHVHNLPRVQGNSPYVTPSHVLQHSGQMWPWALSLQLCGNFANWARKKNFSFYWSQTGIHFGAKLGTVFLFFSCVFCSDRNKVIVGDVLNCFVLWKVLFNMLKRHFGQIYVAYSEITKANCMSSRIDK